jgi:hypothetical protein
MGYSLTSFFVILLGWYSAVEEWACTHIRTYSRMFHAFMDTVHAPSHQWRIYEDHAVPFGYHHKHRSFGPLTEHHWIYDSNQNRLMSTSFRRSSMKRCTIGWLSAEIEIETKHHALRVYSMDRFLETFHMDAGNGYYPPLSALFLAWCIYEGRWFSDMIGIRFRVIDEYASDHEYRMSHSILRFRSADGSHRLHLPPPPSIKKIDDSTTSI